MKKIVSNSGEPNAMISAAYKEFIEALKLQTGAEYPLKSVAFYTAGDCIRRLMSSTIERAQLSTELLACQALLHAVTAERDQMSAYCTRLSESLGAANIQLNEAQARILVLELQQAGLFSDLPRTQWPS